MSSTASTTGITRINLDTLRGLACFFLVIYHATESMLTNMGTTVESAYLINQIFTPVRMPLFSFLSGIVYAYRPVERHTAKAFALGKLRRLVIPFVVMTIVMLAMKTVYPSGTPSTLVNTPHYLVYAYSHLWFLQAILIVFCLYGIADFLWPHRPHFVAAGMLLLGIIGFFTPLRQIQAFSFGDGLYLLPFFALGVAVNRWQDQLFSHRFLAILATLSVLVIGYALGTMNDTVSGDISRKTLAGLTVGLSGVLFFLLCIPGYRPLARIGEFSFTIYLFHPVFTAIAVRVGPENPILMLSFIVIVALFFSIVAELFIKHYTPFMGWVIGKRSSFSFGTRAVRQGET